MALVVGPRCPILQVMKLRPLLLVLAPFLLASVVCPQTIPLTHAEILGRLAKGESPSFVARLVRERGLNFAITDSFLTQVKAAGGDGVLVEHLSSLNSVTVGTGLEEKPVEHLAKCAELVHIADTESAVAECRASIEENATSPWPLIISADLLLRIATPRTPADASNWDEERAIEKEYSEFLKRAQDLDPQRLTSRELEAGTVNPYQFLTKPPAVDPQPVLPKVNLVGEFTPDPELASTHRNQAYSYFLAQDVENAERELKEAIRLEPENTVNHTCLAFLYLSDQRESAGIQELSATIQIAPFDDDHREVLANKLEEFGRTPEAIAELKKLLAISPRDVKTSGDLVELYLKHKDPKAAIEELQRSLKATSLIYNDEARFIEMRFWDLDRLGYLLKQTRQFDAAAEQYHFLLRYQPENPDLHNNYGNVLMDQHRLDEAIAEYNLALRYNPELSSAHHNIGLCLSQQKKFDGAIEEFHRALNLNPAEPHTEIYLGIALGRQGEGDVSAAKDVFQQYIDKNAKDAGAHIDLAYALDQLKDTAGAIKELKLALELDSDSPDAQNDLAWIYATADDPKLRNAAEALTLARKAIKGSPTPNPAFLDTLAEALLLNGQPLEALKIEKQVAVLDPNNPDIPARLAHFQAAYSQVSPSKQ
jgi:tetratricopeptide (TPR) repeat protein